MKRELIDNLQFITVCIIGIMLCFLGLKALDTYEKNRALERCYPNDIIVKYTNQNEKYYNCKK